MAPHEKAGSTMDVIYEDDLIGVVWKPRNMKTTSDHTDQKSSVQAESAGILRPSAELDALPVAVACYTLDSSIEAQIGHNGEIQVS